MTKAPTPALHYSQCYPYPSDTSLLIDHPGGAPSCLEFILTPWQDRGVVLPFHRVCSGVFRVYLTGYDLQTGREMHAEMAQRNPISKCPEQQGRVEGAESFRLAVIYVIHPILTFWWLFGYWVDRDARRRQAGRWKRGGGDQQTRAYSRLDAG